MFIKFTKETFLSMDIAEIQGYWLTFYCMEKPGNGLLDNPSYYTEAMAEFHARGIDDVCTILDAGEFYRDLDVKPFDKEISLSAAKGLLTKMRNNNDYRIFSVEFIKRTTNEYRKMKCRFGVTKYLAGGKKTFDDVEKELKTVFDVEKVGYRSINLPEIIALKIAGTRYLIEENKELLARLPQ